MSKDPTQGTTGLDGVIGQIEVVTLDARNSAFIRTSMVAAVISLDDRGPARIVFAGGGHLDVCGSAEIWRREIEIAAMETASVKRA